MNFRLHYPMSVLRRHHRHSHRVEACCENPPLTLGEGRGEGELPTTKAPSPCPLPGGEGSDSTARISRHVLTPRRQRSAVAPLGFTLLEVILALAILAGSMAALGEVMQLAHRNATMAEAETQAQILAASLMDEFASGSRKLDVADQQTIDDKSDPPWVYSVAIEDSNIEELVAVHLRVEQQMDARLQPASFELVRWMPNPNNVSSESSDSSESSTEGSSSSSSSTTPKSGT